jgi:hypothetical protein
VLKIESVRESEMYVFVRVRLEERGGNKESEREADMERERQRGDTKRQTSRNTIKSMLDRE